MLEVAITTRLMLAEHAVLKNVSGYESVYVLLDCRSGVQYDLNQMEYEILSLVQQGVDLVSVVKLVQEEYPDKQPEIIKCDIKEYIDALHSIGLVVYS